MFISSPLASSKEVILWLGENPWSAPIREALPPESAPKGKAPVGVRPFNCKTCSDSSLKYCSQVNMNRSGFKIKGSFKIKIGIFWRNPISDLRTENTLAIFPIALILFLITSFLTWAWPENNEEVEVCEHMTWFMIGWKLKYLYDVVIDLCNNMSPDKKISLISYIIILIHFITRWYQIVIKKRRHTYAKNATKLRKQENSTWLDLLSFSSIHSLYVIRSASELKFKNINLL